MEDKTIISLGGSLIIPEEVDTTFLKEFKKLILSEVEKGKKFIIITGGGKIARKYHAAARELTNPSNEDLDWIGIASLKLNAELMRVVFGEYAHNEVIADLAKPFSFNTPILIGSAYEPGHSTDWDAVMAAKSVGAKKIINLSNIDYVYDADPKTNPGAKKIEKTSWSEYRKLIPSKWISGLNSPFDPTASAECEKEGIEVIIMNGRPIDNFAKYLNGESFQGTVIS